jgi:hypothetical protein
MSGLDVDSALAHTYEIGCLLPLHDAQGVFNPVQAQYYQGQSELYLNLFVWSSFYIISSGLFSNPSCNSRSHEVHDDSNEHVYDRGQSVYTAKEHHTIYFLQ